MENIDLIPKRRRKVIKFIIDNPDDIAFLTIRELATQLDVDPSTVMRACKDMGYEGFNDLKNQHKLAYKKKLTVYDSMLDKLTVDSPLEDIIRSSFSADLDVLNRTISEHSWQSIVEVVQKISKSNRTYIIGLEASSALAYFLASELRTYLPNVHEITHTNGYLFDFKRHFCEEDVVLGISFGRCIRQTVLAIKEALEKGATTVSITDSKLSPLYKYSHISLLAASSSEFYFSAFVGALSISNAIINCCAEMERERSVEQLEIVKRQWEEAKIWYTET